MCVRASVFVCVVFYVCGVTVGASECVRGGYVRVCASVCLWNGQERFNATISKLGLNI